MPDGKDYFEKSDYGWNRIAKLLYFESPAGVGFSYTDDPDPYYDDEISASDNLAALK